MINLNKKGGDKMKKTITIKIIKSWNGRQEGGYVGNSYIWDWQLEDVVKDYKRQGYKIKLVEIKK